MTFHTNKEKLILIILVASTFIMIVVSLYLSINIQHKDKLNSISVIQTGGYIEDEFKENYEKNKHNIGKYDIRSRNPSSVLSNVLAKDCNNIAENIRDIYNDYDAFIIVCDSDIITYISSSLSFMLENLNKPVILTDKKLVQTLILASACKIPEVMVFSQGKLLRGCRTVHKTPEYVESPNYKPLDMYNSLQMPQESMQIKMLNPKVKIVVIKIFPGIDEKFLLNILNDTGINGIIFEIYCVGTNPTTPKILNTIKKLAKKGIVMVAVSQCDEIKDVNVDIRLLEAGVLSGYDMTSPAAYAKLNFLLSNVKDKKIIGQLMDKSFRGEMTM